MYKDKNTDFQEIDMDAKELGRQVFTRRKEKGLSQDKLGKIAGISRNYVSLIEHGKAYSISMKIINQLAVALGGPPAELTGESNAQSIIMISPALREFGLQNNLSYDTIDRLARIPRRGKEPKSVKDWQALYDAISQFIEEEEK